MGSVIKGVVEGTDGSQYSEVSTTSEGQVRVEDATTRDLLTALLEETRKTNLLLLQLIHS